MTSSDELLKEYTKIYNEQTEYITWYNTYKLLCDNLFEHINKYTNTQFKNNTLIEFYDNSPIYVKNQFQTYINNVNNPNKFTSYLFPKIKEITKNTELMHELINYININKNEIDGLYSYIENNKNITAFDDRQLNIFIEFNKIFMEIKLGCFFCFCHENIKNRNDLMTVTKPIIEKIYNEIYEKIYGCF